MHVSSSDLTAESAGWAQVSSFQEWDSQVNCSSPSPHINSLLLYWSISSLSHTHLLDLLLLCVDLFLEGGHPPLVSLCPQHSVRLPACSQVCTHLRVLGGHLLDLVRLKTHDGPHSWGRHKHVPSFCLLHVLHERLDPPFFLGLSVHLLLLSLPSTQLARQLLFPGLLGLLLDKMWEWVWLKEGGGRSFQRWLAHLAHLDGSSVAITSMEEDMPTSIW